MERLTKRSENGTAVYNTPSGDPVKWENNRHKVLQKLAEYEDLEEKLKKDYNSNIDLKTIVKYFIETIFDGEKHEGFCILTNEDAKIWEEYRSIGTSEECQETSERQMENKDTENIWILIDYIINTIHSCPFKDESDINFEDECVGFGEVGCRECIFRHLDKLKC